VTNRLKAPLALTLTFCLILLGAVRASAETLFSLYPVLQVTEGYNDNITLVATHALGDWVNTDLGGFALDWGGGGRAGSLQYYTIIQTFANYTQFNSYANTNFITLNDQEQLSPTLSMFVNDSVAIGNITGGLLVGNTGALSSQVAQSAVSNTETVSNVFDVNFSKKINENWTAQLGVVQDFYSITTQSSYQQGGTLSLLRSLMPNIQAGLSYTFNDFRFSNEPPSESHSPQLVIDWDITRVFSLDLSGGLVAIDNFGGPSGSFLVKPAGTGTLTYRGERLTASLSGGQNASLTGGLGGTGLTRFASGVVTYALFRNTFAHVGVSYDQFVGGGANGSIISYGAGVSTRPRKWLTLFALYQGFQNSVTSTSFPTITGLTVPMGQTATSNTYLVGVKIAIDVYDHAFDLP
jgi:hypothetical protein